MPFPAIWRVCTTKHFLVRSPPTDVGAPLAGTQPPNIFSVRTFCRPGLHYTPHKILLFFSINLSSSSEENGFLLAQAIMSTHLIYRFCSLLCVYHYADRCFNSLIETRKAEKDKIGLSRTNQERIVRAYSGNDYKTMETGVCTRCGSEAHNKSLLTLVAATVAD